MPLRQQRPHPRAATPAARRRFREPRRALIDSATTSRPLRSLGVEDRLQVEGHVPGRLQALRGVLPQAVPHHPFQGGGCEKPEGEVGRVHPDRGHGLRGEPPRRPAPRQHLVKQGAQGEEVAAARRPAPRAPARAPCSPTVPRTVPGSERRVRVVEPGPAIAARHVARGRGRSRGSSCARRAVRNRFSGFRSRWTMPGSCAAARPRAICAPASTALRGRHGPAAEPRAQRLALEQLGDRVGRPSSRRSRGSARMLGWESAATACASRRSAQAPRRPRPALAAGP